LISKANEKIWYGKLCSGIDNYSPFSVESVFFTEGQVISDFPKAKGRILDEKLY
jgi:hypothetical protein